jgi:chromosome segregation protein
VAREMRELSGQVESLERHVEGCATHHRLLRVQIGEAQSMLDRARQLGHQGELALLHAEKDHAAADGQANAHAKRLEVLSAELESLTLAMTEADIEHAAEAEALEGARADLLAMSGQIAHAERALAERRDQVNAQQALVMDRRVKLAQLHEKLSAERATAERLERSEAELVEREKRLDTELCDGEREAGETASLLHLHRDRLGETMQAAKVARDSLTESRAAFEVLREGMQNREVALRDLRASADRVKDDLARHEMALREHELAMMHLVGSVREKFRGLALAHVVGDYHLRPPPDATVRSRTSELTSLIDRMGAVNLDATREYEEAEKRFAFYTDQKADLDKAIADLEQAIGQMNRESKQLFEDTFVAVSARFREIFPKMFRGGRAELRLTNPADMLETGIEIIAQPPGKKLSSIELMSGGEKALTAVALIFAIFQIKPSPFCILDEVDAPLDEANVGRYCEMVRTMTDKSQFILITHIKKTMQFVDMLSGVTMGEPGVSRLVTVKVTEALANQSLPVKAGTMQPAADVADVA